MLFSRCFFLSRFPLYTPPPSPKIMEISGDSYGSVEEATRRVKQIYLKHLAVSRVNYALSFLFVVFFFPGRGPYLLVCKIVEANPEKQSIRQLERVGNLHGMGSTLDRGAY